MKLQTKKYFPRLTMFYSAFVLLLILLFLNRVANASRPDSLIYLKEKWKTESLTRAVKAFSSAGVTNLPVAELKKSFKAYNIILMGDTLLTDSIQVDSLKRSACMFIFYFDQPGIKAKNSLIINHAFQEIAGSKTKPLSLQKEGEKITKEILKQYKNEIIIPVLVSGNPTAGMLTKITGYCNSPRKLAGLIEIKQEGSSKHTIHEEWRDLLFFVQCSESDLGKQLKVGINPKTFALYNFKVYLHYNLEDVGSNIDLSILEPQLISMPKSSLVQVKVPEAIIANNDEANVSFVNEDKSKNQKPVFKTAIARQDSLKPNTSIYKIKSGESLQEGKLTGKPSGDSTRPYADSLWKKGFMWKYCELMITTGTTAIDKKANIILKTLIDSLLLRSYGLKKYDSLYWFVRSSRNLNSINESFLNKIILAECYERFDDVNKAYENYRWLVFNWQDNSNLSRKESMLRFQKFQFLTLRFDDCIELNQRIYTDYNDETAIGRIMASMRAKYAVPVVNALQYFLKYSLDKEQLPPMLTSISKFIPSYYTSITLMKGDKAKPEILFSQTSFPVKYDLKGGNSVMCKIENKMVLIYVRAEKAGLIVLQLRTDPSASQSRLLGNLKQQQGSSRLWKQIEEEEKGGYALVAVLAAKVLEGDYPVGQEMLSGFWTELKKGSNYLYYIARYDDSGKIIDSRSFKHEKGSFPENQYEKSSKTMGFFKQVIDYEGREVIDITNPIYKNTKYTGTLRIGFLK